MASRPIQKLLIANRGEIAARIMRTAHQMGIETVAVYSQADADAPYVRQAGQAVCIGAPAPAESYLNVDRILQAAQATGADAIHPGYGFLSENADFVQACHKAGLIFVGPSADAIRTMGDKARAKTLMAEAGVPCVPGYAEDDQSPDRLRRAAQKIGYPVMIKASAGGGGRGMRLVTTPSDFDAALTSARSEAMTGFGDDRVLLEKAISTPRHIEIQVMADTHGHAVHMGERDCSIQRRHQKLIEEAPSPAVTPELRAQMGQVALKAVQAIGYVGAGTLEFLLDADGQFYFMEMNTRLQVEHPVTEAVTGLDLVALQLCIAAGEPLGLQQSDIRITGHAIEARLCAEDTENGFLPQNGQILTWQAPAGLRVDHALRDGMHVPAEYDSMLAKLVAHGPDRQTARQKLIQGLNRLRVDGIRTNQGLLADCLAHPLFAQGKATTGFLDEVQQDLFDPLSKLEHRAAQRVAALLLTPTKGPALGHGFGVPLRLGRADRVHDLLVTPQRSGACTIRMAKQEVHLTPLPYGHVEQDGVAEPASLTRDGDRLWLHWCGRSWDFRDLSYAPATVSETGNGVIRALMTGRVGAVTVSVGDRVDLGAPLLVLEAMKMEHAHTADLAGTIRAVHVTPGDQVDAHRVLIEIEAEGES